MTYRSHVRTTSCTATRQEARNVSRVVVHTLYGDVARSQVGVEGSHEGRANDPTDVAVLKCAPRENQCELFAWQARGDVVAGYARKIDVAAALNGRGYFSRGRGCGAWGDSLNDGARSC